MELKLNTPSKFEFLRGLHNALHISLPSAGVVLHLDSAERELFNQEVDRFWCETIAHSHYILERFKGQHTFLASVIETLRHEELWGYNGFSAKALNAEGTALGFETESLLSLIPAAFGTNQKLRRIAESLAAKVYPKDALPQWPSIISVASLSSIDKEEYKAKPKAFFHIPSSGRLAGMVMPVIFHSQELDITLNSGKIEVHIKGDDAIAFCEASLNPDELAEFNMAKQAWTGLETLETGIHTFLKAMKSNGYDSDSDSFDESASNIEGLHQALLNLYNGLKSESAMTELNNQNK